MTKDELNAIFQAVHKEMLEDRSIERLMEKMKEDVHQCENPISIDTIVPHIALMTMDYNKEFMFRVLLKALERV